MTRDSMLTLDVKRVLPPLVATFVVHACLVWLLGRGDQVSVRRNASAVTEQRSLLILLPPVPAPPSLQAPKAAESLPAKEARRPNLDTTGQRTGIHDSATKVSAPRVEEAATPAPLDWDLEAELSSKNMATQMYAEPQQRSLDGSGSKRHATQTPIKKPDFDWRPQTKRYGITAEGAPYFQLNDRCVLVLPLFPFIGCGIGKMPPPNRKLFEDMGHPHLPASSAPGPNE